MTSSAVAPIENAMFETTKQDKVFRLILASLFVLYLIVGIVVPAMERVEIPREIKEQIPAQLAKIMIEEKKIEKEKPKPVEPEDKPKEDKEPPKTKREAAREKAQTSGLAAMKDELFSMRDAFKMEDAPKTKLNKTKSVETKVQRKLLSAKANTQSTGINAAQTTDTVVSAELSTKQTQQVRLSEEEVIADGDALVSDDEYASLEGQRSEMGVRRTIESNKASLYALYNRALRKDPTLQGKVVFEIEIQPNGSISHVAITSSELGDEKLERRLLLRLKAINFGAEDVDAMTTIWAIEFLPS
ncbi:AgmX/PglI C-terminal domain-containing protein [Algibacillus agarilyticus]|uniref:AgmX/PglI C-terminal domain-containing protein n=1 Tax=Algibacillus agarilyticus TaxID=2234133 RepID=UPI001300960F|nr:AgmX/PglI C-terminal domain-containing protein [Algibacillus agarilyticus]